MTLISVVTITKDDFDGVKKTVLSLSALRKLGVRQLIVDGSDTGISKKVKKLAVDNGVDYFWQKPSGVASAFNFGLSKCDSEWVWFLNGGDTVLRNINNDMFLYLVGNSNSDAMIFQIKDKSGVVDLSPFVYMYPPVYNWIPHPSSLVRKKILDNVGGFNRKYSIASDGDVWFKIIHSGAKIDLISVPIVYFKSDGISSNEIQRNNEQRKVVLSNVLKICLNFVKKIWQVVNFIFFK